MISRFRRKVKTSSIVRNDTQRSSIVSCRLFGTTYGTPSSRPSLTLEDVTVRLAVTQRRLVVIYRRFGTTYEPHTQGSDLNYIFFIYPAAKVSVFDKIFLKASVGPI